jgi:hypothetical protein
MLALWRSEKQRGSLRAGKDRKGRQFDEVTPRQFLAAAVHAIALVNREGGNVARLFASTVNQRAWLYITDIEWRDAESRLNEHQTDPKRANGSLIEAAHAVHERTKLPLFVCAQQVAEQMGLGELTPEAWENMKWAL